MEVGEYVRDCDGFIVKVNEIQDYKEYGDIWYEENTLKGTWKSMVVKHSPNIIDLIEVGDYVNGSKVISIDYAEDKEGNCDKLHYYYQFEDDEKDINEYYETLKIKSIVTKEQFASMEYKIEAEE